MTKPINAQLVCGNGRCGRKLRKAPATLCAACLRALPITLRQNIEGALNNQARVDAVWSAVSFLHHVEDTDLAHCVVCGCTDERACPGGCYWAADPKRPGQDVCSQCVGK